MSIHWGGRGPGHMSRKTSIAGLSPYTIFGTDLLWWHDLQDPTTRFSDFIGTPAVAGDRTQLLMDKAPWQGRTLAQELAQQAELRGNGTTGLVGSATAATYNTGTGAGTVARVDASNQSYIEFTGLTNNVYYAVTVSCASGVAAIRSGLFSGNIVFSVSAGNTVTGYVLAANNRVTITNITSAGTADFTISSVKAIPGAHAYNNSTISTRPYLRQSAWGAYYLEADGVDDFMVTNALDLSSTDKVAVFTAARKLVDTSTAVLMELSADSATNNGTFGLFAPSSSGSNSYRFGSKGSATQSVAGTGVFAAAPNSAVLTGLGNISGDSTILRMNGSLVEQSTADQGAGNYGSAYALNYFRRGGISLPFSGYFWGAFGAKGVPTDPQIAQSEALLNRYAQAY